MVRADSPVRNRGSYGLDPQFDDGGARARAYVTFEPGARTAWHTHPLGQTLVAYGDSRVAALDVVSIAEGKVSNDQYNG
jgi:hypothetical protein